ncbi:MAG: hypothetical protein IPP68_00495 [Elusimicrobia bacterium]|nr:hypothetical protein [Elusimicrobiota bacterium]
MWHTVLYFLTRVTSNPHSMQLVHLGAATLGVFLFARFSPFSNLHKVLFSFGYFVFYEFAVVSRGYVLELPIVFGVCFMLLRSARRLWPIGFLLALLANTSVFGAIIALAFTGTVFANRFPRFGISGGKLARIADEGLFLLIVGLGMILFFVQIRPPADAGAHMKLIYSEHINWGAPLICLKLLATGLLPLPNIIIVQGWSSNFFIQFDPTGGWLAGASVLAILVCLVSEWRDPSAIVFFLLGIGGILVFQLMVFSYLGVTVRHCGHLFVVLVAALWLSFGSGARPRGRVLTVLLSLHVIGGAFAYARDLFFPFSRSAEAAEFILRGEWRNWPIAGSRDYLVSPLSAYLGRKIYYLNTDTIGSFIHWNEYREKPQSPAVAVRVLEKMSEATGYPILLVLSYPLDSPKVEWLSSSFNIRKLAEFNGAIVADESYYLYRLTRK